MCHHHSLTCHLQREPGMEAPTQQKQHLTGTSVLPCEPQTSPGLGEPNMGTWWSGVPSVLGPSWQQLRGMGGPQL